MLIKLFDQPKVYGNYLEVGKYANNSIYIGDMPPKEWIAMTTDDGKGICINESAFGALKKCPKALLFLENICEHELSNGPVHEHYGDRSELDKEIIQYFKQQRILE